VRREGFFVSNRVLALGVNPPGVLTFPVPGIRPLSWWEADRARKVTRTAMALWAVLLLSLCLVIFAMWKLSE